MVDRWTVEKAIRESSMRPAGRHVLLTLLTWSEHDTAVIPVRFSPSLTTLAKSTGYARSTIARWLNRTEADGWLMRGRPTPHDARRYKRRTTYRLRIPEGFKPVDAVNEGAETGGDAGRQYADVSPAGTQHGETATTVPAHSRAVRAAVATVAIPDASLAARRGGQGLDHRYVEGPNGMCAVTGCTRSAPLHAPARRGRDGRYPVEATR